MDQAKRIHSFYQVKDLFHASGTDKHLRDIAGMLANSSEVIDFSFLSDQMKPLGLEREWQKAKGFSTP